MASKWFAWRVRRFSNDEATLLASMSKCSHLIRFKYSFKFIADKEKRKKGSFNYFYLIIL